MRSVKLKDLRVSCIFKVHRQGLSDRQLIRLRYLGRYFKLAWTSASHIGMYFLSFVIKLFVGEVTRIDTSPSIATDSFVSGFFLSLFGDANLYGDTNPLIFLVGFYLNKEEPLISFDFFDFFFRYAEYISACEHIFFGEGLLVRLIKF